MDEEREKRMAEEKKWQQDPTELLNLADMESGKAWTKQNRIVKLKGLWGKFLCRIGWHHWSDQTIPCHIHCMRCLLSLNEYLQNRKTEK